MLSMLDRFSRRQILTVGTLGLGGLSLPQCFADQDAQPAPRRNDFSVILLWLPGGPSHFETFDPKPNAPAEVRGEFADMATSVPGIRISELMPASARRMDRFAIVRTMAHTHNDHDASQWMLSGYFYTPVAETLQYPSMGSVFTRLAGGTVSFPPYWHTPLYGKFVVKAPEGFGAGYLGSRYDPILIEGNPNHASFRFAGLDLPEAMSPQRLSQRRSLLSQLDGAVRSVDQAGVVASRDRHYQRAFDLVRSSAVRQAFMLNREDVRTRDRYGRNQFGQCTLLARRLVEAGARFVNVRGPGSGFDWDTHAQSFTQHKNVLVPPVDTAFSALLDDLQARGLLPTTMVLLMGEFGRTPRINTAAGRDHWQHCYSIAVAGPVSKEGAPLGSRTRKALIRALRLTGLTIYAPPSTNS